MSLLDEGSGAKVTLVWTGLWKHGGYNYVIDQLIYQAIVRFIGEILILYHRWNC